MVINLLNIDFEDYDFCCLGDEYNWNSWNNQLDSLSAIEKLRIGKQCMSSHLLFNSPSSG